MVGTSGLGVSQLAISCARDPRLKTEDTIFDASENLVPASIETSVKQPDMADTTLFTPNVTRPKRHAAVKALETLSAAYQPLIIQAAHSERRSSGAFVDGNASDPHNGTEGTSTLLVIDDMLPPADGSEGDSDAYEATAPRKRTSMRTGEKRKRGHVSADGPSVRRPRGKKRVDKLDRDDLRLIARAAQGLISGEERKRSRKQKVKAGVMLDALKRAEVERLVRLIEETMDWGKTAVQLSEVTAGPSKREDKAEQAQSHTTSPGLTRSGPYPAILNMANCERVLTAGSLREHWSNVLSSRIVSMYKE